jgi:cold-inducible RNA-binding protein
MRLFVGNLSYQTDERQLEELFAPFGAVESATVVRDRETGRSRGFAFVELADDAGKTACETLNQREFDGRRLTINEAKPQERQGGGFGGGGRSGGFGRPKREARW